MTLPVDYDDRQFRRGDTVRSYDNDDRCVVLGRWGDWLRLDPTDYHNAAPFTAHTYDYYVVKVGPNPRNGRIVRRNLRLERRPNTDFRRRTRQQKWPAPRERTR